MLSTGNIVADEYQKVCRTRLHQYVHGKQASTEGVTGEQISAYVQYLC